ncbi:MAG: gliding motility-associated C-terminal domain-containing protein, partial [Chitinophagales bacterium]
IGATNTTASNAIEINQYDTIGRKNITYDSDYYAGFTNIAVTAADVMPDISTSAQFFNGNYRVCAGDSVDFFSSKSGIDYIWTLGGGATPNVRQGDSLMTLRDVVFETPDTFWITLQVESDCCGLSDRDSLLLVVDSLPGAFIQPDTLTTLCQGQSVTLTAGGGTTYEWNTGQVTQSISVTPPVGMNPYVVEVTSDLGCKNYSDTTFVEVNPGPAIEIVGDNTVCPGDSTVLSVSGFPGSNITWWNENGDTIVSNTITVTTDSLIEYFARAENLSCYSNIDSITVFADELPEAVIVGDSIGCLGDSITVMATGSKDYVWNNGDSSAVQTFFVTGDTTVSVIPISATGCVGDEVFFDINAVQFREVEVSLSADPNPVCPDDEVTFTADPTFGGTAPEYAWVINGDTVEVNSDSVYTYYGSEEGDLVHVVLFSNEACITGNPAASNEIEIEHFELPEVALQELDSSYIIYDDPVPLVGAPEGGEYAGDGVENNAFNPELLEVGGPYFVTYTYTDSNGCANSDTVQTFIEEVDELYGLPNAFSPNSGGVNGTFSIVNSGAVSLKQAQIFNRWGELVHNKTSPWDGTYNGKLQPAGTYVYYFVIVLPDGEEVQETGNFSLIR